ncbi:MAG: hypothetical protein HY681_10305 [Chloroflexi bacterium]|nr:hypothetical protein [Chloroflexota bacterium]
MASTGYFVKPKELTDEERQKLQELMDKIRKERDRRRELYGPIDVAALIREVREEQAGDETGR